MLNLNSIMVGTSQPKVLAEFYEKVLGKKPEYAEEGWFGFQIGTCMLSIGEHSEVNGSAKEPQRLILNIETKEIKDEYERIKATGATVIKELYGFEEGDDASIATFADPDGNYFQLMVPWDQGEEK